MMFWLIQAQSGLWPTLAFSQNQTSFSIRFKNEIILTGSYQNYATRTYKTVQI